MLSRIVKMMERDGKPDYTVELTQAGATMAALWRGIHARWSFLTASNFIVMPDHLHLLLIVDYSKALDFDILDWFQHFRREGEDLVAPLIGEKAPLVWEDHFWMLLVNAGRPLAAVRKYIKLNPARKMWKTLNSDRFIRRGGLRHAVLDPSLTWTAIGDLTILASPFMFPVRLTRRMTVEQHLPEIKRMVERLAVECCQYAVFFRRVRRNWSGVCGKSRLAGGSRRCLTVFRNDSIQRLRIRGSSPTDAS